MRITAGWLVVAERSKRAIRAARPGDGAAIARVFVDAARQAWVGFVPRVQELSSSASTWENEIASPLATVLVAEQSREIVGFAVTRPSLDPDERGTTGELHMIYTLPTAWGTGVGRELLTAALDNLRRRGFLEATLWTGEPNERPRRVFEAAGWVADGARRPIDYLGARFDNVRYRIELQSVAADIADPS